MAKKECFLGSNGSKRWWRLYNTVKSCWTQQRGASTTGAQTSHIPYQEAERRFAIMSEEGMWPVALLLHWVNRLDLFELRVCRRPLCCFPMTEPIGHDDPHWVPYWVLWIVYTWTLWIFSILDLSSLDVSTVWAYWHSLPVWCKYINVMLKSISVKKCKWPLQWPLLQCKG